MGAAVQPKRRQQLNEWESDSFIVLRGRESLLHVNAKQKRKARGRDEQAYAAFKGNSSR